MKLLIISASPRKGGNSDTLCDEFSKGAIKVGHTVEKIFLKEKKINYCTGCGLCINKQGTCSQKDDMEEIKNLLIDADAIVFATPIYFYTMAGQLKTFIDRWCFFYKEIKNKDFYYIMTAADSDKDAMRRAFVELDGFVSCLEGIKEKGCIYGIGLWNKGDVDGSKVMHEAYEMGKTI